MKRGVEIMKVLLIGGTGTISMAVTRLLAQKENVELYILNRGSRVKDLPEKVTVIKADMGMTAKIYRRITML